MNLIHDQQMEQLIRLQKLSHFSNEGQEGKYNKETNLIDAILFQQSKKESLASNPGSHNRIAIVFGIK